MEKNIFLVPPCALVASTVAFQPKGNFSWPFLGFHIYFKIPIASLALEKSALPWRAPFAAFVVTITYRKLSALGAAGVSETWWGWIWVCKDHLHMHPSLQAAARHNPTLDSHRSFALSLLEPAGGTCPGLRARGRRKKLNSPLVGPWVLVQSPDAAFWPEQRPTQRRFSRISVQQKMRGRGMNPRKTRSATPKSVQ